jgi:hypothetical protein
MVDPTSAEWRRRMIASLVGKRVRLIHCADPHAGLESGAEGTVAYVDEAATVHIDWDSGGRLGLAPDRDRWEWIEEKRI